MEQESREGRAVCTGWMQDGCFPRTANWVDSTLSHGHGSHGTPLSHWNTTQVVAWYPGIGANTLQLLQLQDHHLRCCLSAHATEMLNACLQRLPMRVPAPLSAPTSFCTTWSSDA
jgi:hypothetical protein